MDSLSVVIISGLVAAFLVSAADYWVDLGIVRAIIALFGAGTSALLLGVSTPSVVVAETFAAAFVAMFLLQIGARINAPIVARGR